MIDLQFSLPNLIFLFFFSFLFFFCTHDDLIRNKKSKSDQLDKVIFGGERYFRNTHFEQKVLSVFQCRVTGADQKINGKAGMLALHANKRRENATT